MRFLILLWLLSTPSSAEPSPKNGNGEHFRIEDHVVRIYATKREVDQSAPWQNEDISQQQYLAALLASGELLTTASAVRDASFLELQRFDSSQREEVVTVFVDYEVDLALLRPVRPVVLKGLKPLAIGDDLALDSVVQVYKLRDSNQLSQVSASLQEVSLGTPSTSAYGLLSYDFKTQQTGLGNAEPVTFAGKLVALTTSQDQNFLSAVPATVMRHFLSDNHDESYRGFPSLGCELSSLTSPDTRALLRAPQVQTGVRVASVYPDASATGHLEVDDVIFEVNGQKVTDQGHVVHGMWGKLPLRFVLNQLYGGDKLTLKLWRNGVERTETLTLKRFDSNRAPVVTYRYGQPEPHLIVGGVIFQELSLAYLRQWGKYWRDIGPLDLLHILRDQNEPLEDPSTRVIIVSRVLADQINRGYSDTRHRRVVAVNGRDVKSMAQLKDALTKPITRDGKLYVVIKLGPEGDELILMESELPAAHARMRKLYEIESERSFWTR